MAINKPGDEYEQEADRVADQVMRMPQQDATLENPTAGSPDDAYEREADRVGDHVMRMPETGAPVSAPSGSAPPWSRGGGSPLSEPTRRFFEPRFGSSFSHVRVHHDDRAARSAHALNARAYTLGHDIIFGPGQYAPGTDAGRRLLAHELTHVVQQGRAGSSPRISRLTEKEKEKDLGSAKYKDNRRLQRAFDNSPALGIGESGDAVRLVQEGLVDAGFAMPLSTKENGELDGQFGAETFRTVKKFQAMYSPSFGAGPEEKPLSIDGVVGRQTMGKLDELAQEFKPPPSLTHTPSVDRIDMIDSSDGAANGFEPVLGKSDLNSPGPFNDAETGECTNVHQVHFRLDRGEASELTPHRQVDTTIRRAGVTLRTRFGDDGPAPFEIRRPSKKKLVVADAPGQKFDTTHLNKERGTNFPTQSDYPFVVHFDFYLMVSDLTGVRIADATYHVDIEKTSRDNIPNKVNRVVLTRKRDLVRNREL